MFLATGRTAGNLGAAGLAAPGPRADRAGRFIPLAEQSFLMRELTAHVVQLALSQASAWRRSGLAAQLSVNVSRRDLLDGSLAATIQRELAGQGLPPAVLLLEISERALTREAADIAGGLSALRTLGIELSVDDFMTGFTSVGRLKEMSVGEVKIDPSFVAAVASNPDTKLIVRSAVDLLRGPASARSPRGSSRRRSRPSCRPWAVTRPRAGGSAGRSTRPPPRRGWRTGARPRSAGPGAAAGVPAPAGVAARARCRAAAGGNPGAERGGPGTAAWTRRPGRKAVGALGAGPRMACMSTAREAGPDPGPGRRVPATTTSDDSAVECNTN